MPNFSADICVGSFCSFCRKFFFNKSEYDMQDFSVDISVGGLCSFCRKFFSINLGTVCRIFLQKFV